MPLLPQTPPSLEPFYAAICEGLSGGSGPVPAGPASLLLRSTRDGAHRMPHAGKPFLDLLRRRIVEFHSEIQPAGSLRLVRERSAIGFDLARGRRLAGALVIAVPLRPLASALPGGQSRMRCLVDLALTSSITLAKAAGSSASWLMRKRSGESTSPTRSTE